MILRINPLNTIQMILFLIKIIPHPKNPGSDHLTRQNRLDRRKRAAMNRRSTETLQGFTVGLGGITLVARKTIARILLIELQHLMIPINFGNN
jgi:hypothetical protein